MAVLNPGHGKTGTGVTSSSPAIPQARVLARHQRYRRLHQGQSVTDNDPPFRFDRMLPAGLRGRHGLRRPAHPSRRFWNGQRSGAGTVGRRLARRRVGGRERLRIAGAL